jgi:phosphoribosylanthranilate isomerase
MKVKICGIRTLEAARASVNAGADFLGFNFVPSSSRFIKPKIALSIIDLIRGRIKVVGVFQDAEIMHVNDITSRLGLDLVQLHGNEQNDYMQQVHVQIIKSVRVDDDIHTIHAKYLLLDRAPRGEGEIVNVEKAAKIAKHFPIFFAGGLTTENVGEIVARVKPFAVDVAGGIETSGLQDLEKIKVFIQNAKGGNGI